jgi:hypothetical protein
MTSMLMVHLPSQPLYPQQCCHPGLNPPNNPSYPVSSEMPTPLFRLSQTSSSNKHEHALVLSPHPLAILRHHRPNTPRAQCRYHIVNPHSSNSPLLLSQDFILALILERQPLHGLRKLPHRPPERLVQRVLEVPGHSRRRADGQATHRTHKLVHLVLVLLLVLLSPSRKEDVLAPSSLPPPPPVPGAADQTLTS